MKKYLLTFFVLFFSLWAVAQDNNDFQDTRRKTESFSRMRRADVRADVATFALAGISESIGKDLLQKTNYSSLENEYMAFEGNGVKAKVTIAPFEKEGHRLDYDYEEKYLIRIDRKSYYGNYGHIPQTYISDVSIIIDGDTVAIPKRAYFDLYNLNFTYQNKGVERTANAVYQSKDGHRTYLYFLSKNNSGSYEVTWVIQDKKYLRRVLDYGFL